jgi:hypothetical protein
VPAFQQCRHLVTGVHADRDNLAVLLLVFSVCSSVKCLDVKDCELTIILIGEQRTKTQILINFFLEYHFRRSTSVAFLNSRPVQNSIAIPPTTITLLTQRRREASCVSLFFPYQGGATGEEVSQQSKITCRGLLPWSAQAHYLRSTFTVNPLRFSFP